MRNNNGHTNAPESVFWGFGCLLLRSNQIKLTPVTSERSNKHLADADAEPFN